MKEIRVVICILVVVFALICARETYAIIVYTVADAPTYTGYANTNFDNYYNAYYSDLDRELWTGNFWGSWNTRAYLKFVLSGLRKIYSAKLWVYNGVSSGKGSDYAPAVVSAFSTSAIWTEKGISWNNQPVLEKLADEKIVGNGVGWNWWDVTSLAQFSAGKDLSIALVSEGSGHVYYASETASGYNPYLEVIIAEPPTLMLFLISIPAFLLSAARKFFGACVSCLVFILVV
ncbi:MAG: DNRLRE domain-containing protein [Candidatus Omnitrophota bacterium]